LYDYCTDICYYLNTLGTALAYYEGRRGDLGRSIVDRLGKGTAMINVDRTLHIDAAPAAVFAALADPHKLAAIMPRVRRVELVERGADHARIATYMAFWPFGDIRTEGDVQWRTDREIIFSSRQPVGVEARWTLTPSGSGTDLRAALSLDLAPLIGPLASFVPQNDVAGMVAPDLDAALAEVARRVKRRQA
jgi:hypothetical protein